ncbi:ankyrin repeat domain-containing protein SOWAHC-like [Cynoglossus semilaevis]|uniref:ankyrin repeat domain-containing protein SOWAHC-like n=1 Tax=Cynoglossus semilaevis TaxID=244447 RepID=UPI000D625F3C|nr:ankyrin repeat domain-containing protein SOWAHC-like [Cynoglossus semilaevis]
MGDVSEEALLDYFSCSGGSSGRVRNADLLKTFKPFIGHADLQLRAKYREEFKLIIDRIAVVKSENGEKFLVLKKKYRQLLQERDTKTLATDEEKHADPAASTPSAQWDATNPATSAAPPMEQQDELMSCGESENATEFESEQDEESTGSMGSAAVALDPIEKEWIYSAAGARVPDLSQLLRQDPTLANKKDFTSGFVSTSLVRHSSQPLVIVSPVHSSCLQPPFPSPGSRVSGPQWSLSDWTGGGSPLVGRDRTVESQGRRARILFNLVHHSCPQGGRPSCPSKTTLANPSGYTPLHIAALHGHQNMLQLLIGTYGAKENVRDYSGHLAGHYLNNKEAEVQDEESELQLQVPQGATGNRERHRNRKLVSLFHSKKKWGSAEDLAPIEEERTTSHQLAPPPYRPRKFSR